jgi:hypothetical protein
MSALNTITKSSQWTQKAIDGLLKKNNWQKGKTMQKIEKTKGKNQQTKIKQTEMEKQALWNGNSLSCKKNALKRLDRSVVMATKR